MKKNVLITGASRGIGKAIALLFAKKNYNLVLTAQKNIDLLNETAKEVSKIGADVLCMCADAGDYEQMKNVFDSATERFGGIDVLVNNAGISHIGLLQDMSPEEWSRVINTNLTSVFNTSSLAIPYMVSKKAGSIINISSVWGISGASCEVAYSASKGGVNSFTKALAKELAPSKISVNAISCGVVDTDMNKCFDKEELEEIINEIPAGRLCTPGEVAELALYLAEASPYITGQIIGIDGGYI